MYISVSEISVYLYNSKMVEDALIRYDSSLNEFLKAPSLSMIYAKPPIAAITWKITISWESGCGRVSFHLFIVGPKNWKYVQAKLYQVKTIGNIYPKAGEKTVSWEKEYTFWWILPFVQPKIQETGPWQQRVWILFYARKFPPIVQLEDEIELCMLCNVRKQTLPTKKEGKKFKFVRKLA